jgi:DNA-binding protein H-NS
MSSQINLDDLTIAELHQLVQDAQQAIDRRKDMEAKNTLAEIKSLVASRGFNLEELLELAAAQRSGDGKKILGKAPMKYRDSSNPENQWSGRGKPPKWMAEAISKGRSKDDFLIAA